MIRLSKNPQEKLADLLGKTTCARVPAHMREWQPDSVEWPWIVTLFTNVLKKFFTIFRRYENKMKTTTEQESKDDHGNSSRG